MALSTPTLHTERLLLRPVDDGDAAALLAMHRKPSVMRYWSTPPWRDLSEAQRFIERSRRQAEDDDGVRLVIVRRQDAALIGQCTLFDWMPQCRRAETGYGLDDAAWHQGYAREALAALLAWGFQTLDLNRVQADIDPRNLASARLLERLGFVLEGTLREHWIVDGEVSDSGLYALLRRDWAARGGR